MVMSSAQISGLLVQQQQAELQRQGFARAIVPPSFSYGGASGFGQDRGTQIGGGAVSALTNFAMPMAQAAVPAAGMLVPGAGLLNPFGMTIGAAKAGFGVGQTAMGAVGGGAWGVAGGIVGGAAAAGAALLPYYATQRAARYVATNIYQGAEQQGILQQHLAGGWGGFVNPMARSGFGFGRTQAMGIGGGLEKLTDAFTQLGDVHRLVGKLGQMGFAAGATDVQRFTREMTGAIKTVKELAIMLNTTMDEALPMFGVARKMGIYGRADILRNAMNQGALRTTGFTAEQAGQLGMMGAQISTAYGATRGIGARAMLRAGGMFGAAAQAGVLTEEEIMEATEGQTGAAAYSTLAGTFMQEGWRRSRGPIGRRLIAAAIRRGKEGELELDPGVLRRYTAGRMGLGELSQMAGAGIQEAGQLGFRVHERRLAGEMMETIGPEFAIRSALRGRDPSAMTDDLIRFMLQKKTRWSRGQIELAVKMIRQMDDVYAKESSNIQRAIEQRYRLAERKKHHSWEGFKSKVGRGLYEFAGRDLQTFGRELAHGVATSAETITDAAWGRWRHTVLGEDTEALRARWVETGGFGPSLGEPLQRSQRGAVNIELERMAAQAGMSVQDLTSQFQAGIFSTPGARDLIGEAIRGRRIEHAGVSAVRPGMGLREVPLTRKQRREWVARAGGAIGEELGLEDFPGGELGIGVTKRLGGNIIGAALGGTDRGMLSAEALHGRLEQEALGAAKLMGAGRGWELGAIGVGAAAIFGSLPGIGLLGTLATGPLAALGESKFWLGDEMKSLTGAKQKDIRKIRAMLKDPRKLDAYRKFLIGERANWREEGFAAVPGAREAALKAAGLADVADDLLAQLGQADITGTGAGVKEKREELSAAFGEVLESREEFARRALTEDAQEAGATLLLRLRRNQKFLPGRVAEGLKGIGQGLEALGEIGELSQESFAGQREQILGGLRGREGRKALRAMQAGRFGAIGLSFAEMHRLGKIRPGALTRVSGSPIEMRQQLAGKLGVSTETVGAWASEARGISLEDGLDRTEAEQLIAKGISDAFGRGLTGGMKGGRTYSESMETVIRKLDTIVTSDHIRVAVVNLNDGKFISPREHIERADAARQILESLPG